MIREGLSEKDRQAGIFFAGTLEEITSILRSAPCVTSPSDRSPD